MNTYFFEDFRQTPQKTKATSRKIVNVHYLSSPPDPKVKEKWANRFFTNLILSSC